MVPLVQEGVLVEMLVHPKIARNCMICPDLFSKVMFSNPSPFTDGIEVVGVFSKTFLLRIEWNVHIYTETHISTNPIFMDVMWPSIYKKSLFSQEWHAMSRSAHISCLATPAHGVWGGVKGPIHEKHTWWKFNEPYNSYFLFHHLHGEFEPIHYNILLKISWNQQICTEISCSITIPWGRALGHITKNNFWLKLHEMYKTCIKLIFSNCPHHQKGLWGVKAQCIQ